MRKILFLLFTLLITQQCVSQIINTEGFESGSMPPPGWTSIGSTSYWSVVTSGTSGTALETVSPNSGSFMGEFNSAGDACLGCGQTICSSAFSRAAVGATIDSISFWMYRDNSAPSTGDSISVYISTTPDFTGATWAGTVARSIFIAVPATVASDGWYYYSFPIPAGYTSSANYILVEAISQNGNNMFIDDISWTSWPAPCSGTPVAGTISTPTTICAGTPFSLSVSGDSLAAGLTYQWYTSPSGAGTFTAIAGATNNFWPIATQDSAMDYFLAVTCVSSGVSDTSGIATVNETIFYKCYCNDGNLDDYSSYTQIDSVNIPGNTLNVSSSSFTPYVFFPFEGDSTATLVQGRTYTIDVNVTAGDSYNSGMWIDYNQDGIFEASEYTFICSNAATGSSSSVSFTVPINALPGTTGMRIRAVPYYYAFGSGDACSDFLDGQTYDFLFTVDTAPACAGTPDVGGASANVIMACSTSTITLSDTAVGPVTGLMLQWEYSADDITWVDIPGATGAPYTLTSGIASTLYYRLMATCTASGLDSISNVLPIVGTACYCTSPEWVFSSPVTANAMSAFYATAGYGGTGITDMGIDVAADPSTGYLDHTSMSPMEMQQGGSYPVSVTFNNSSTEYETQVWIDFGNDGVFDATDTVTPVFGFSSSTSSSSASSMISIPATAIPGYHRMRVRNAWLDFGSYTGTVSDPMDPCADGDPYVLYGNGDVVDYIVYIVPTYCDSVSGIIAGSVTATTATIKWNSIVGSADYEYIINTSALTPTGPGIGSVDTSISLTGLMSGTTYYAYVRNSCGTDDFSVWQYTTFTTNCDTVTGVDINSITATSATIIWNSVAGSTTYDYQVDGSPGAPVGSGISIPDTTIELSGLPGGATYYAHVRNSCPGGGYSAWVTTPFSTLCDAITGLAAGSITDTTATITWTAVAGSTDYQYTVNTSPAAPTGAGTVVSGTLVNIDSLTPGTIYYVHVRNACAGGGYSSWVTVPFTSGFCDSVLPSAILILPNDTGVTFSFTGVSGSLGYYYTVNDTPGAPSGGGIYTTGTIVTVNGLTPGSTYYIHIQTACGGGYSTWTTVPFSTTMCDSVMGLAIVSSDDTGLVFSFTASPGSLGYYYTVTTTPGTPSGGGTFTTSTLDTVTDLVPGTTYYVYVRSSCGGGFSTWTYTTSATEPCDTVTGLAVYTNDTFAYVTWNADSGAAGYDYVIDTNPGTPTGSGTFTTATADSITSGLMPDTIYYAHVRVNCGAGNFSGWVTVQFTLLSCDTTAAYANVLSDSSAHIGWIFQGGAGYNYALNTSPGTPSSGVITAAAIDTGITVDTLMPNTTYYFHIEVICNADSGITSSWITISFTTPRAVAVITVNSVDFGVAAYPNPTVNVVTVKVTGMKGNGAVTLTDITGKELRKLTMTTASAAIDMGDIANGIYLLKYQDDAHSENIKVIKE